MGEVWKARDTRLDRSVAAKVSKEALSDRFEREARAVAAMQHPNICALFDVGAGKWIAYHSNESGRFEIYVRPFDRKQFSTGSRIQISNQGGNDPLWSGDGREIFFGNSRDVGVPVFSARIRVGPEGIEAEAPTQLFAMPEAPGPHTWAVSSDGQHFLIEQVSRQTGAAPLTVLVNWQAKLKK